MSTRAGSSRPQAGALSAPEFIALMAMLFATIALSIDAMLPALPDIGAELSPAAPNRAQLVVIAFVVGMGAGTFITGPLSDALGRKPVIIGGAAVYIVGALLASMAGSLGMLLAARALQGLGAAGPRVVGMAVVRDLHAGREMARLMSFVMMVFTLVPAVAPLIGAGIIAVAGWRGVFYAFVIFALIGAAWTVLRLPETLPRPSRRPFRAGPILAAAVEVFAQPVVVVAILVLTLCFAMLFAMLVSVQPVYDIHFGRAAGFPYWFGLVSLVAVSASFVNAALVVRLGMRYLVTAMLALQVGLSSAYLLGFLAGLPAPWDFAAFVIWQISIFFQAGLTIGNLNALAMEPLGHIAGLAASIIGGVSTVLAMPIAALVGQAFNGTPGPLALGILVLAMLALGLMLWLRRIEARIGTEF